MCKSHPAGLVLIDQVSIEEGIVTLYRLLVDLDVRAGVSVPGHGPTSPDLHQTEDSSASAAP